MNLKNDALVPDLRTDSTHERLDYLDVAKCLAIFAMILGHCGMNASAPYLSSIRMPFFFLISGYFLSTTRTFRDESTRRAKSLLQPYFICALLIVVFQCVLNLAYKQVHDPVRSALSLLYGCAVDVEYLGLHQVDAIWFLNALFVSSILVLLGRRLPMSWGILLYGGLSVAVYQRDWYTWLPFSLHQGLFAAILVYMGTLARRYRLLSYPMTWGGVLLALCIFLFSAFSGARFYIVKAYAENGLYTFFGAIAGVILLIQLSRWIAQIPILNSVLRFLGKHTLFLLCAHAIESVVFPWGVYFYYIPLDRDNMLELFLAKSSLCVLCLLIYVAAKRMIVREAKPLASL